jgi:hypothetical protein
LTRLAEREMHLLDMVSRARDDLSCKWHRAPEYFCTIFCWRNSSLQTCSWIQRQKILALKGGADFDGTTNVAERRLLVRSLQDHHVTSQILKQRETEFPFSKTENQQKLFLHSMLSIMLLPNICVCPWLCVHYFEPISKSLKP